jgi:DNA replication protein DnaC
MNPLSTSIDPELTKAMRALKLGKLLDVLPQRLRQAREQSLDPEHWLLLLLGDEVERRRQAAVRLRADRAGMAPELVLEAWMRRPELRYDAALLDRLTTMRFVQEHHHVCIQGPVGVGKTMLAHGLGHAAVVRGMTVHCTTADAMFTELRASRLDQSHSQLMRRLCSVQLLIIDDLGLRPLTEVESRDLGDIVFERHRKASMIVTSNREPAEWLPLLSDRLLAEAIVDRFSNNAFDLVIDGPSYRRNQKPGAEPA